MARPVIATKLYVPRPRPGLVPRPRLLERLRHGAKSRLTLVSAPAGFGKSTLLAAWLGERAAEGPAQGFTATSAETPSVAWVSLDHGDSEPASFWTYVLTAIGKAAEGVGANALAQLEQDAAAIEPALTTLVNELAQAERGLTIVLDDYHHLPGCREPRGGGGPGLSAGAPPAAGACRGQHPCRPGSAALADEGAA